jgi:hypothetical protein
MNMNNKINFRTLAICFVVNIVCFFLISFIYTKIVFNSFSDVVAGLKSHSTTLKFASPIMQKRLATFGRWLFGKDLLVFAFLTLMNIGIGVYRKKFYREVLIAYILFVILYFLWLHSLKLPGELLNW